MGTRVVKSQRGGHHEWDRVASDGLGLEAARRGRTRGSIRRFTGDQRRQPARIPRCIWRGLPPPDWSVEKPPAMACGACRYSSKQLSTDVRILFGELHVPAAGQSQNVRLALANRA